MRAIAAEEFKKTWLWNKTGSKTWTN